MGVLYDYFRAPDAAEGRKQSRLMDRSGLTPVLTVQSSNLLRWIWPVRCAVAVVAEGERHHDAATREWCECDPALTST